MHDQPAFVTKAIEIVVHCSFPAIVFVISSRITVAQLLSELKRPVLLLKILLISNFLVPLITAWIVRISDLPLVAAGIILVASMAPGDSFALLEARDKKGRVSLAAVSMVWLCLAMPVTVPLWAMLFGRWFRYHLAISPADVFSSIAPLTLAPLCAGVIIRHVAPKVSDLLERIVSVFATCAIGVATIAGLILAAHAFKQYTPGTFAAIAAIVTLALAAGYYYSGCEDRADRISMGLTASLGNFAVIILIAHENYPREHIAGAAIAFVIVRWLVIMFWHLVMRLCVRLKGETLA